VHIYSPLSSERNHASFFYVKLYIDIFGINICFQDNKMRQTDKPTETKRREGEKVE